MSCSRENKTQYYYKIIWQKKKKKKKEREREKDLYHHMGLNLNFSKEDSKKDLYCNIYQSMGLKVK